MSKKTPVKKSKRRLKRSVRRSLAAILMITAIGVAAVPVPENTAATDDNNNTQAPIVSAKQDLHTDALSGLNFKYLETGQKYATDINGNLLNDKGEIVTDKDNAQEVSDLKGQDEPITDIILNKFANATTAQLITALGETDSDTTDPGSTTGSSAKKAYASLAITDIGGEYDLCWQFIYYLTGDPISGTTRGVICKYNSAYSADDVDLAMTPTTGYHIVEEANIRNYFKGTYKVNMEPKGNPTREITFSYAEYKQGYEYPVNVEDVYFLTEIYGEQYNRVLAEYKTYKTGFDAAKAAYQKDSNNTGNYTEEMYNTANGLTTPDDFSVKPADVLYPEGSDANLITDEQLQYFSRYDTGLEDGFSLTRVIDSRISTMVSSDSSSGNNTSGNSNFVYVAQHDSKTTGAGRDKFGFQITSVGVPVCAIGENAFKGVTNVTELVIPDQIGYIGDEAFANATLMTSIKIGNVKQIGNRAFKGCVALATVEISRGTTIIGAECFRGTAIKEITLPISTSVIGYGAFAGCENLTTLKLDEIRGSETNGCVIKDFAFYNCYALNDVQMSESSIRKIGKGAFAVNAGAVALNITMPKGMTASNSIGDFMFAGRSTLEYVVFPERYGGENNPAALPSNMFHGCTNLQYVTFPADYRNNPYVGGFVTYDPKLLFSDVTNPDFYVRGPEKRNVAEIADPRQTTWKAVTWVNEFVPYVFTNAEGIECYEVVIDGYRYQANEKGELLSCVLVDATGGNLKIPSKVGNYPITTIKPGCFGDEPYDSEENKLRDSITSIEIEDSSISAIGDGVFKGLPNLKSVIIGNSVTSIGASAFENCKNLVDVTFHTPPSYEGFTIKENAFKTGGNKLTFHGDIVEGYAPFDWAMSPSNKMNNLGMRVCYQSLFPTYLKVIYDPNTGLRTLIDYPKFDQIDNILDAAYQDEYTQYGYNSYGDMMAATYYAAYEGEAYNNLREEFRNAWNDAENADDVYTDPNVYGPWVNPGWIKSTWGKSAASAGGSDTGIGNLTDWLFEPLVAYAAPAGTPEAYYTHFEYSAQKNADAGRGLTDEESRLIDSAKNLVIPAGIDSIDVHGYRYGRDDYANNDQLVQENYNNFREYVIAAVDKNSLNMYTTSAGSDPNDTTESVAGLFSGFYEDGNHGEQFKRGNDRIETVAMSSVQYLPDYAFDSCENLRRVVLGDACSDIGTAPFRGCTSLKDVGDNAWYETVNGIVYSKNKADDGTTDLGTYTIEECLAARGRLVGRGEIIDVNDPNITSVSYIRPGAFEECVNITTVDLSTATSLTEIPEDCFRNCAALTNVSLARTIKSVEAGAFENANNLVSLTIPGKEVFISAKAFKDNNKTQTTVYTREDSSVRRYVDTYGNDYNLVHRAKEEWRVVFIGADGKQVGEDQYVEDGGYVTAPEYQGPENWKHTGWLGTNNITDREQIFADTVFVAQGSYTNGMVDGRWVVNFIDGVTGESFWPTQYADDGGTVDEAPPSPPNHSPDYTFLKYSADFANVTSNLSVVALYTPNGSGGGTGINGGTTSGGTTNNGNKSSGSTTNTSGSSTSTTSSTGAKPRHTVTVVNGYGSGSYAEGETVIIVANEPASGQKFSQWRTESEGVELVMILASATTFVMPANNVLVTAEFTGGDAAAPASVTPTPTLGTVSTRTTGTGTTNNNGNTRVDITKPGISNKSLATANVNGSTDNFIVKISETPEATQAVQNALTNKYGNLDDILYYAMDISLYDSTGITKITDTTGLSVDITIPVPDALVTYGGNNMMGAVVSDQIEDLSERFTTINGVPCISFTATHFSPYTIYVNTQNLSEGLLDITPKTGDPIHPKWFLSLGLASLSVILFMKKDRRVKVKTA